MTKAERLAAKIQRDRDTLEKQRQVLADSEATLRAEIRHSEAALRDEERKATDKRRYQVGALAEEAGLFAMSNTELAEVFAALGALRAGERPGAVLEALVGYPERFSEVVWRMGRDDAPGAGDRARKRRGKKSGAIGVSLRETHTQEDSDTMHRTYDHPLTKADVTALLVALGLEVFVCGCGGRCPHCACLDDDRGRGAAVRRFTREELQLLHADLTGG